MQQLYFIAIMLPQWVDNEIITFKNDMEQRFQSKKALRTASHITLKAPFKLPAAAHSNVLDWFNNMNITVAPFIQNIKDFGAFNNKRNPVIYVQPVMNASLQQLQHEVLQQFIPAFPKEPVSRQEHIFSPHITIAYRDLQSRYFKEAWEEYKTKQYRVEFEVNAFQLLLHTDGRWKMISNYTLNAVTLLPTVKNI